MHGATSALEAKVLTVFEIHEAVNIAVHHTFINQSEALMNTLQNIIKQVLEGTIHQEPSKGPQ
jgi:hypothetical protein